MPIDLNNLSDDVLSYCNDRLYTFIEENLGVDEMMLIKMQSINNVRTLINVPDIMAFLCFNSKEIIELKSRICFIDEDNKRFMVKAGIKTNIDSLISALKAKIKKQTKRTKTFNSSTQLNSDQSNTFASSISNLASIDPQLAPVFSTTPKINSSYYYIHKISDNIEKFCVNTFENIILTNGIDYMVHLNILDADINGCINCGCNTSIKIGFRSKSNSFQLSAYLTHLKNSRCSMIKKKKQGLDKVCSINNKLSNFVLQDDNSNTNNTQNVSDEKNFVDEDDNFSTTINNPIITASNGSGTKRSLASRSTSSITKKMRSS